MKRVLVNNIFTEARKLLADGDAEKAGFKLLQAHKGLPKYKALIKLLSEEGNKTLLLKTENHYMQEQSKNMHLVTDELYFIIEEIRISTNPQIFDSIIGEIQIQSNIIFNS